MNTRPAVELCDDAEFQKLDAFLAEQIHAFNEKATGYLDGKLQGGQLRGPSGEVIAAFNGHTWGDCCVVTHLWVHELHRGVGAGRALLQTAEAEAVRRGCEQVVVSTHSFQAPGFYERLGYERQAVVQGQPRGHAHVTYVKHVGPPRET